MIRGRLLSHARPLLVCLLLAQLQPVAIAQDLRLRAERLAASCTGCHGTNGVSAGSGIPGLAGKSRETIINAMREFKSGTRPATVMHQLAKGYGEQQIELIAQFFSQQIAPKE